MCIYVPLENAIRMSPCAEPLLVLAAKFQMEKFLRELGWMAIS